MDHKNLKHKQREILHIKIAICLKQKNLKQQKI